MAAAATAAVNTTSTATTLSEEAVDFRARLLDLSAAFCSNVTIKDRQYRFKTYGQCFLGTEAVDFFVDCGFARSRQGAVHLGRFLASEFQLFEHVCGDHLLKDKYLFYRFDFDNDQEDQKTSESGSGNGNGVGGGGGGRYSMDTLMKSVRLENKSSVNTTTLADEAPPQPMRSSLGQKLQRISLVAGGVSMKKIDSLPLPPPPEPKDRRRASSPPALLERPPGLVRSSTLGWRTKSLEKKSSGNPVAIDFDKIGAAGREDDLKRLEGIAIKKLGPTTTTISSKENGNNNNNNTPPIISRSAILVEGPSGCGKCSLVRELCSNVKEKLEASSSSPSTSILVGNGKFEQKFERQPKLVGMPYYALTQAAGEIVDQLFIHIYKKDDEDDFGSSSLSSSARERFRYKHKLREGMDLSSDSARAFSSLIPRLGDLLLDKSIGAYLSSESDDDDGYDDHDDGDDLIGESHSTHKDMQEQLGQLGFDGIKAAFRDLFRVLSTDFSIVLRLDDMQFADRESILLLECLLGDKILKEKPFLFIGTHTVNSNSNSNSISNNSSSSADFMRARRETFKAEEIRLENLSVAGVNQLVHKLLKLDKEETQQLAATIHDKTQGNPFFVTQFLSVMEQKGLLTFSMDNFRWEFKLSEVTKMDLADNVADVLAENFRGLPATQREILVLASITGSTEFETDVIEVLIQPYRQFQVANEGTGDKKDLLDLVEPLDWALHLEQEIGQLVNLGFVNKGPLPGHYRVAHDKVRQAGLSFLPSSPDQRKHLFLLLGKELQKMVEASRSIDLQASLLIFQAVGLLNQAQDLVTQTNERKSLAKLNYKAAKMATARSSFFPASDFLGTAAGLLKTLPKDGWGPTYDLMLQITDLQVLVEFRCGRLDKSNEVADEVLGNSKTFNERKHAYFGKTLALMESGESMKAKKLAINVLALLGVTFPTNITRAHAVAVKKLVMNLVGSNSDDDLLKLPQLTDSNAMSIIQFLDRLAELCFADGKPDHMTGMLCLAWTLETTLRYGNSKLSCISFVHFSMLCMILDSPKEAHRFGELALRFLKVQPGVARYDYRARKLYAYWIGHWRYSYQHCVVSLGAVMKECWKKGVLENYFIDSTAYFEVFLCSGLSLGPLYADIQRIAGQMRDNQRVHALHNEAPLFQLVTNLVGSGDVDSSTFSGNYFQTELQQQWIEYGNSQTLQRMYLFQIIHCYFFNLYKEAHELMLKLWSDDNLGTSPLLVYQAFFRGMVSFACAQRNKHYQPMRNKHIKAGKEVIKKFTAWVERGNVNAHHLLLLLKAEELTTTSKVSHGDVREAFDAAISAAARLGFLHSRAIGNERAGLFFLKEGDQEWASTYMQRASDSFLEWGATAKVDQIQLKHRSLVRGGKGRESFCASTLPPVHKRSSQARLGVSRLEQLSTASHHSLESAMSSQSIDSESFADLSLSFCDELSGDDGSGCSIKRQPQVF